MKACGARWVLGGALLVAAVGMCRRVEAEVPCGSEGPSAVVAGGACTGARRVERTAGEIDVQIGRWSRDLLGMLEKVIGDLGKYDRPGEALASFEYFGEQFVLVFWRSYASDDRDQEVSFGGPGMHSWGFDTVLLRARDPRGSDLKELMSLDRGLIVARLGSAYDPDDPLGPRRWSAGIHQWGWELSSSAEQSTRAQMVIERAVGRVLELHGLVPDGTVKEGCSARDRDFEEIVGEPRPPLTPTMQTTSARKHGLKGCEYYPGDELCISVSAANREGTLHGGLAPSCGGSSAARPPVQEGTELSIIMARGTIADLAFQLQCMLGLAGGVVAAPEVSDLTLVDLRWEGLLGRQPAGPIPTSERRKIWMVLKDGGSRVEITGE